MKRNCLLLLGIAALVTFSGCRKEISELPAEEGTYHFTLQASASGYEATRVSLEDDMIFSWTKGDGISVLFHKGSDNKFFTLTAESDGASTIFGGTVTSGYTLGSDSGEKYALYPANGQHSYTSGKISYFVPDEVDFTESHFTAFIPMVALGDDSDNFVFNPMVSVVKFTFSDIARSVSKVRFTVQNQTTFKLSGPFECTTADSNPVLFWGPKWHQPGTAEGRLSFISGVNSGKATFYIPFTPWSGADFKPVITLTDASDDAVLYTATAKAGIPSDYTEDLSHIIIMPDIKAHAPQAWTFPSQYGIDWNQEGTASDTLDGILHCFKAKADKDNIYVYFEIEDVGDIPANVSFSHLSHIYFSGEEFESWLIYEGKPRYLNWNGTNIGSSVAQHGGYTCYEAAFQRSGLSSVSGSSAYLSMVIHDTYVSYDEGGNEVWEGSDEDLGTAGEITISLP